MHERRAALSLKQKMRDGVGGVTVVTYTPSGKDIKQLIKNVDFVVSKSIFIKKISRER